MQALFTDWEELHLEDERGRTPLHCAADEGHLEIVTALIEAKADVTRGRARDKCLLLECNAMLIVCCHWCRLTPLLLAAGRGHMECIEVAHEAGLGSMPCGSEYGPDIR